MKFKNLTYITYQVFPNEKANTLQTIRMLESLSNSGLNVKIIEPDVSPLQLQGPTSTEIMVKLFGENIRDLKYYWLREFDLNGIP